MDYLWLLNQGWTGREPLMHIFATARLFARVSGPDLPACENVDLLIYAGEAPALFISAEAVDSDFEKNASIFTVLVLYL